MTKMMSRLCLGANLRKILQALERSRSQDGRVADSVLSSKIPLFSLYGVLKQRSQFQPSLGGHQLRTSLSPLLALGSGSHPLKKKQNPPETLGEAAEMTQIVRKKSERLRVSQLLGTIAKRQSQHGESHPRSPNRGEDGRQQPRMRRHLRREMFSGGMSRRTKEWLRSLLSKTRDGGMIAHLKEMTEIRTPQRNLGDKAKANTAEEMAAVIEAATEVTTELVEEVVTEKTEAHMEEMEVSEAMEEVTEEMM